VDIKKQIKINCYLYFIFNYLFYLILLLLFIFFTITENVTTIFMGNSVTFRSDKKNLLYYENVRNRVSPLSHSKLGRVQ